MKVVLLALTLLLAGSLHAGGDKTARRTTVFDYTGYHKLLQTYVKDGWVDYTAMKADAGKLDDFLARTSSLSKAELEAWPRSEQFAFYINLYNAATLRLVLDHYPLKSIKEIGSFFKGPWKQEVVSLFGEKTTLDHLEHGILRKMGDPRIHFAINCASIGCPRLVSEAYTAEKLDRQLDAAAWAFLSEQNKNSFNKETNSFSLSPIFKWFKTDFVSKSGSVRKYVENFVEEDKKDLLRTGDLEYGDYDWTLNDLKNK